MIQKTQKAIATLLTILVVELIIMVVSGDIKIPLITFTLVAVGYALCLLNHTHE